MKNDFLYVYLRTSPRTQYWHILLAVLEFGRLALDFVLKGINPKVYTAAGSELLACVMRSAILKTLKHFHT